MRWNGFDALLRRQSKISLISRHASSLNGGEAGDDEFFCISMTSFVRSIQLSSAVSTLGLGRVTAVKLGSCAETLATSRDLAEHPAAAPC